MNIIPYLISLVPKLLLGVLLFSIFSIYILSQFSFMFHLALSAWFFKQSIRQPSLQLSNERIPHCSHSFSKKTAVSSVKNNIYHGMVQMSHSGKQTKQGNIVVKSIARNTIMLSNGTHCLSRAYVHIFPRFLCPIHDYWNQITVRSATDTYIYILDSRLL